MQPCRHCHPTLRKKLSTKLLSGPKLLNKASHLIRRSYATTTNSQNSTMSVRLQTLLPRILSNENLSVWNRALRRITSHDTRHPKRIAVYSLDRSADTHSLITALLDNPLASHGDEFKALKNISVKHHEPIIIAFSGSTQSPKVDKIPRIEANLSRLTYFNAEVLQIPSSHPDPLPLLWSADVKLLITTPYALPVSLEFLSLVSHPSTLLVIQYPNGDQGIIHYTLSSIAREHPEVISSVTAYAVYPLKASSASDAFRSNSSTVDSVDVFQRDYLESGISPVIQKVHSLLSSSNDKLEEGKPASTIIGAVDACYKSIQLSRSDVSAAQRQMNTLRLMVESARTDKLKADEGLYPLDVPDSVRKSTQRMTRTLHQIPWWKLPFVVDDLGYILNTAIQHTWCADLIPHLHYRAGRLSSLREQSISQTRYCFSQLPKPFQSAVMKNVLEQYSSELNEIGPDSLCYPLAHRVEQLGQVVIRLHRQVQKALFASSCGLLGSSAAVYTGWFSQYLIGYDALGLGALAIVVVLRLFIRSWDKAQSKWWADWDRAGQGLERDVKGVLERMYEEKVLAVPLKALEMLQASIDQRAAELDAIQKELDEIRINSLKLKNTSQSNTI